jgi:hypothetical protein
MAPPADDDRERAAELVHEHGPTARVARARRDSATLPPSGKSFLAIA